VSKFINKTLSEYRQGFIINFLVNNLQGNIMTKVLWLLFAVIIGGFNAIAIAAALLVIDPTISQAGAIAWVFGGFVAGFFIAQRKGK
jgi:hypothetical protein